MSTISGSFKVLALPLLLGVLTSGCQVNPMAPTPAAILPTGLTNIAQMEVGGTNVFFSPTSIAPSPVCPMFLTATFAYSSGGLSNVYSKPGPAEGTQNHGTGIVYLGSSLCPGNNCIATPNYRGVGGPKGDFNNDYFLRYRGHKGPDPTNDYNSLQLKFSPAGNVEHDMSNYQGFIFWARGHGNFSVDLAARMNGNPGDFIAPTILSGAPYSGWNFYLKRFGKELNGDTEWKQISVRFSEMVQEYGLASDLPTVLRRMTGLQFDQQVPITADFQLDLDYIYFF